MKSLWSDAEAAQFAGPLGPRVYTSRLLGRDRSLVLHGGGNTSVKLREKNLFGEEEDVLYVKGSGWDLETIEPAGFTPVALGYVRKLASLPRLPDPQMVNELNTHMLKAGSPSPSTTFPLSSITRSVLARAFDQCTWCALIRKRSGASITEKWLHTPSCRPSRAAQRSAAARSMRASCHSARLSCLGDSVVMGGSSSRVMGSRAAFARGRTVAKRKTAVNERAAGTTMKPRLRRWEPVRAALRRNRRGGD